MVLLLAAGLLAGCDASSPGDGGGQGAKAAKPAAGTDKAPAEAESSDAPKPVVLTAEERQKLGIATAPAQAITFSDASAAFGVVLSHETIAQAVADLVTAASFRRQSAAWGGRSRSAGAAPSWSTA